MPDLNCDSCSRKIVGAAIACKACEAVRCRSCFNDDSGGCLSCRSDTKATVIAIDGKHARNPEFIAGDLANAVKESGKIKTQTLPNRSVAKRWLKDHVEIKGVFGHVIGYVHRYRCIECETKLKPGKPGRRCKDCR